MFFVFISENKEIIIINKLKMRKQLSFDSSFSPSQSPKRKVHLKKDSIASISEVLAYHQAKNASQNFSFTSLKSFMSSERQFIKINFSKGEYYEGTVDELFIPDGQGCFYFSNGDQYSGDVKKGVKTGYGKYTYSDGAFYIGNWYENLKQGEGEFVSVNKGWRYIGTFDKDIPIKGNFVDGYEDNVDVSYHYDRYDGDSVCDLNLNYENEDGFIDVTRNSLISLRQSFDLQKGLTPVKNNTNTDKNIDSASTMLNENDGCGGVKAFNLSL